MLQKPRVQTFVRNLDVCYLSTWLGLFLAALRYVKHLWSHKSARQRRRGIFKHFHRLVSYTSDNTAYVNWDMRPTKFYADPVLLKVKSIRMPFLRNLPFLLFLLQGVAPMSRWWSCINSPWLSSAAVFNAVLINRLTWLTPVCVSNRKRVSSWS